MLFRPVSNGRMPTCLEPTSPGKRRRPAPDSSPSSRTPSTSTSPCPTRSSRAPPCSGSPARSPGRARFADLVGATVHEIVLNGEKLDAFDVYRDSRIRARQPPGRQRAPRVCELPYSHTGEGLHRFVDPADGRVYLYSQFEVPDARRVFTTFEQPDLKSAFTFTVTAPAHWEVVSNAPTPEPEDARRRQGGLAVPGHPADVDVHHRADRRRVPRGPRHLPGQARRHRARPLLPPELVDHLDSDDVVEDHQAGLRVLRGGLRLPLPVREVRPALRARVQHGRDGERRRA